jgi:orotate phosphoribosyltransferase
MDDKQLIQRICDTALLRGDFTLRSGRKSKYYLDKYLFETQPDILKALGERFAKHVRDVPGGVDCLAGPELGGVALVAAASMASGKPCVFIRNEKKGYGTAKQLEGKLEKGDRVLIVEDIGTTGGQVLEGAKVLLGLGAVIVKIVVVLDRQEGARENIEAAGFEFASLFTKAELGINE